MGEERKSVISAASIRESLKKKAGRPRGRPRKFSVGQSLEPVKTRKHFSWLNEKNKIYLDQIALDTGHGLKHLLDLCVDHARTNGALDNVEPAELVEPKSVLRARELIEAWEQKSRIRQKQ